MPCVSVTRGPADQSTRPRVATEAARVTEITLVILKMKTHKLHLFPPLKYVWALCNHFNSMKIQIRKQGVPPMKVLLKCLCLS